MQTAGKLTFAQCSGTDESHLSSVLSPHQLMPDVVEAFSAMQTAAAKDGIDISIASSYRSFERQLAIWNAKWLGKRPLYDRQGQTLDYHTLSETQKLHAILTWSALPGTSRHHWGTDLDVYDHQTISNCGHSLQLVEAEYLAGGPCYKLSCWLQQHASEYGFHRPYYQQTYTQGVAPEPWHLSFAPLACQCLSLLNEDALASLLASSALEGKTAVLAHLEQLLTQYVYPYQEQHP